MDAHAGSGAALARFAARVAAGERTAVAFLGGSVTFGVGASWWGTCESRILSNVCLGIYRLPASSVAGRQRLALELACMRCMRDEHCAGGGDAPLPLLLCSIPIPRYGLAQEA